MYFEVCDTRLIFLKIKQGDQNSYGIRINPDFSRLCLSKSIRYRLIFLQLLGQLLVPMDIRIDVDFCPSIQVGVS